VDCSLRCPENFVALGNSREPPVEHVSQPDQIM
jgi:hypothetical protein